MAPTVKHKWLHRRVSALLRDLDDFIAAELNDESNWREHELAPVRSSIAHAEWVLADIGAGLDWGGLKS